MIPLITHYGSDDVDMVKEILKIIILMVMNNNESSRKYLIQLKKIIVYDSTSFNIIWSCLESFLEKQQLTSSKNKESCELILYFIKYLSSIPGSDEQLLKRLYKDDYFTILKSIIAATIASEQLSLSLVILETLHALLGIYDLRGVYERNVNSFKSNFSVTNQKRRRVRNQYSLPGSSVLETKSGNGLKSTFSNMISNGVIKDIITAKRKKTIEEKSYHRTSVFVSSCLQNVFADLKSDLVQLFSLLKQIYKREQAKDYRLFVWYMNMLCEIFLGTSKDHVSLNNSVFSQVFVLWNFGYVLRKCQESFERKEYDILIDCLTCFQNLLKCLSMLNSDEKVDEIQNRLFYEVEHFSVFYNILKVSDFPRAFKQKTIVILDIVLQTISKLSQAGAVRRGTQGINQGKELSLTVKPWIKKYMSSTCFANLVLHLGGWKVEGIYSNECISLYNLLKMALSVDEACLWQYDYLKIITQWLTEYRLKNTPNYDLNNCGAAPLAELLTMNLRKFFIEIARNKLAVLEMLLPGRKHNSSTLEIKPRRRNQNSKKKAKLSDKNDSDIESSQGDGLDYAGKFQQEAENELTF